jgi:spore germination cell wall hydrolase CwlJ-like protein
MPRRLPAALDDFTLLAVTVAMEAADQTERGKVGVAYAIMNRADAGGQSVADVVFSKAQFSSWMTGSPTLLWIDSLPAGTWDACLKAAAAAYWRLLPDPTQGARHYLNPEVTKQLRAKQGLGYTLPDWAHAPGDAGRLDDARVTMREGDHVWLRVG